jgi:hypothetical protein
MVSALLIPTVWMMMINPDSFVRWNCPKEPSMYFMMKTVTVIPTRDLMRYAGFQVSIQYIRNRLGPGTCPPELNTIPNEDTLYPGNSPIAFNFTGTPTADLGRIHFRYTYSVSH